MPITKVDHVELPYAGRRHTPDYSRLAALYSRGGETLADLSVQRGQHSARLFERLGALFSGYQELEQQKKATAGAAALRERDRSDRLSETAAERAERSAERKAVREERDTDRAEDRTARESERTTGLVERTVNATRPGVNPALFSQVQRLAPTLAERFQVQDGVPVLMRTPEQARQAEIDKTTAADRVATAADREADNKRADSALALQRQVANQRTTATPEKKIFIRKGELVPLANNELQPGDMPYSAEAMQGMGGEASDARSMRTAAALNSIDVLKELAPKRMNGPAGMIQGGLESAKGAIGYNTGVKQYNALLGPTAMQMAIALQGAAGLSNAERETMKGMLGSISSMDYQSQMALLDRATDMLSKGSDVAFVDVVDPRTKQPKKMWRPMRSRMPGAVTMGDGTIPGVTPTPPSDPAGLFLKPK